MKLSQNWKDIAWFVGMVAVAVGCALSGLGIERAVAGGSLDKAQTAFELSEGKRYNWTNLRRTDHDFAKLHCGDSQLGDLRMCAIVSRAFDPNTGAAAPFAHYDHFACTPRGCAWFNSVAP